MLFPLCSRQSLALSPGGKHGWKLYAPAPNTNPLSSSSYASAPLKLKIIMLAPGPVSEREVLDVSKLYSNGESSQILFKKTCRHFFFYLIINTISHLANCFRSRHRVQLQVEVYPVQNCLNTRACWYWNPCVSFDSGLTNGSIWKCDFCQTSLRLFLLMVSSLSTTCYWLSVLIGKRPSGTSNLVWLVIPGLMGVLLSSASSMTLFLLGLLNYWDSSSVK